MADAKSQPRDEKLIGLVLTGDTQAFNKLVERYFGMVYVIGYSRLAHRERSEDLAQEVFLRAFLSLKQLKQPQFFSAWLTRMARNLATDWLRHDQRSSKLLQLVPLEELPTELPDTRMKVTRQMLEQKDNHNAMQAAMLQLSPELRELVMLRYTEELDTDEIARRLLVHPTTVRRQLKKALAQMRGMLEPVLRETAPVFKPSPKAAARTIAVIGTVAAMSAGVKTSLAVAAGTFAVGDLGLASTTGVSTIGKFLGLLKTILATASTGGKTMITVKGVVVAAAALCIFGGGYYYYQHSSYNVGMRPVRTAVAYGQPGVAAVPMVAAVRANTPAQQQTPQSQSVDPADPVSVGTAFFTAIAEKNTAAALQHVLPEQRTAFENNFKRGLPPIPAKFQLRIESKIEKQSAQVQMVNQEFGLDLTYQNDRWWVKK